MSRRCLATLVALGCFACTQPENGDSPGLQEGEASPPAPSESPPNLSLEEVIASISRDLLVDSALSEPRLVGDASDPRLALPPGLYQVVHMAAPGMRTWSLSSFGGYASLSPWEPNAHQALFAVIGDLDGDGHGDAAILGPSAGDHVLLLALSNDGEPKVMERSRQPLHPNPNAYQTYGTGFGIRYIAAGRYFCMDDPPEQDIPEAFEELFFEKAAQIVYLERGEFRVCGTAD